MGGFIASAVSIFLLAASTLGQSNFLNQTAPFYLSIISENATYNGLNLSPVHSGAAIEVLALSTGTSAREQFYLNFTTCK